MREQERHDPEDAFELLLHGVAHRFEHRIARAQPLLQRAQNLVGPVMPDDLGGQEQFHRRGIQAHLRMHRPQLVERGDDPVAQRRIGVEQAADQDLLGLHRPDPHQH